MSASGKAFYRIGAVLFFSVLFLAAAPWAGLPWQEYHPLSAHFSIYNFGHLDGLHLQGRLPEPRTLGFFTEESSQGCSKFGPPTAKETRLHRRAGSPGRPSLSFITSKVSAYLLNSVLIL
jgi:hypothetical protein